MWHSLPGRDCDSGREDFGVGPNLGACGGGVVNRRASLGPGNCGWSGGIFIKCSVKHFFFISISNLGHHLH